MARSNRSGRVLATAAAVACVMVPAQRASAQEQKPPAPVSIVESVPLPISGTVTIGGDAAVTVKNADTAPVPVRDVDRRARQHFQTSTVPTSFSGRSATGNVVTVPAGKRLVVEQVSAWINSGGPGGLLGANLLSGDPLHVQAVSCVPQGQNALNYIFVCAGPTKHYVESGQTLRFGLETIADEGGFYRVFVSGYYEPVP